MGRVLDDFHGKGGFHGRTHVDFMGNMEKHGETWGILSNLWGKHGKTGVLFFGEEEFALEHHHVIPWKQRKSSNFSRAEVAARHPDWLIIIHELGPFVLNQQGLNGK
jgi:hypothetical protein